ncbi:MAG: hypothetical protein M3303_05420 [Gemmatimonadota bacterium]|nr:hypothetical protein [Gemmatimonadota bacterium]
MRRLASVCCAIGWLCLGAPVARGQTAQPISVQLSGLYEGLAGDAFDDVRPGAGFEAQLRYTRGAWSVGLGYQTTRHRYRYCALPAATTCLAVISGQFSGAGVFFEPRYVLDAGSDVFAPYLSGRFSLVRQRADGDPDYEFSVSGSSANAGGGLLVRMSPRVNFDAGGTVGYTRFSSFRSVDRRTGAVLTGVEGGTSGSNFVLRVGVAIGIG